MVFAEAQSSHNQRPGTLRAVMGPQGDMTQGRVRAAGRFGVLLWGYWLAQGRERMLGGRHIVWGGERRAGVRRLD